MPSPSTSNGARKYLFLVSSSYGHLFPAIRLAHLLQRRGKEVLFVTAREHQFPFDTHGIQCIAVPNQPHPFLSTYDWFDSAAASQQYHLIQQVFEEYAPDAIVATPLVMPAFALAEVHAVPLTVIGYCEYLFPSVGEVGSSKQWRIESFTGHYNGLREQLRLPLLHADPAASPLIGDRHVLRSVPQFTDQENLPPQVTFAGGLLWEPGYINLELDRFIARHRAEGRLLLFVQIGRLFNDQESWRALVALLGRVPAAFIVDIARSDYMTDHAEFPENLYLHPFVPMGHVKDVISGVLCSGQTTSVVSAICHGKPILGIPNSADGAEVIRRVVSHGIGAGLWQRNELHEDALLRFLKDVEGERFSDGLRPLQRQFLSHDQDAQVFERIFT
jgi:UDP:flavonoid glycosyltransferase YjiC (YdhE family)